MKKQFRLVFTAIITLLFFTTVTYTACVKDKCEKIQCINGGGCNEGICICPDGYEGTYCEIKTDPCKNITCQNNGSCADGKCDCLVGYEGTYCEQLTRDKIIGVYTGTSDCGGGSSPSSVTIAAGTSDLTLILNGDNGIFSNQTAIVTSKTTFEFAFPIPPSYAVSGTGTITSGGVTITSTITGGVGGPSGNPAVTTCTFKGKK